MKSLLIWGDEVVGALALECAVQMRIYQRIHFVEIHQRNHLQRIKNEVHQFDEVIVAVSDCEDRKTKFNFVQALQGTITSLIHPSCKLSESATILNGCILLSNVVLCDHVTIGMCCLLHENISIENDTIVENFTDL